jgi:hypothetical protein
MQILDQAVAIMRAGKGRADGAKVAAKLEAIAALGEQAAQIWQGYLDRPGAAGDKNALVTWVGAARAKQLYELSLGARVLVNEVCAGAGDQARFLVLDESPIVLAYAGLKEGQTGPQAAQIALAAQQVNNKRLRELADRVRAAKAAPAGKVPAAKAAKPKKAAGKPAGAKKPRAAAKKSAPKKAGKKAAKKVAKKPAGKAGKKRR